MHHWKVGRIWGSSSIQFKLFSLVEMAEVEIIVTEEVKRLKNEIKALRKELDKPNAPKEELLTFDMLDRH